MTFLQALYLTSIGVLTLHLLHRVYLVSRFRWLRGPAPQSLSNEELPTVTVQLPLYNERTVASRLIRAVGEFDYPKDRLEIQVLDDSDDETRDIVDDEVERLRERGLDAVVVRRPSRTGFKAGALQHGLGEARGDFLCIFDADFEPRRDFLRALLPHFQDASVGMVQARWDHDNREESALTRAQSVLLDGHFVIEHTVRHDRACFFNFNGTAGIWRREAIADGGGWQHDTLTEDLDLSYRVQLAGWRFVYAPLVTAPAEVPPTIGAFKSQQHRWAKGSVQVARKQLGTILRADLPARVKLEAAAHLGSYSGYPFVLLLVLLTPLMLLLDHPRYGSNVWLPPGLFLGSLVSLGLFYGTAQGVVGRGWRAALRDIPAAVALGIGISISQTRAVIAGLFGRTGEFVRTPKRGSHPERGLSYALKAGFPGLEVLVGAWLAYACVAASARGMWGTLPFLMLFTSGFVWVGCLTLRDWTQARRRQRWIG